MPLSTSPGALYTWGGTAWDWDDVRAGKTWDTSYASAYTEDDSESVGIGEVPAKVATTPRSESFSVAELAQRLAEVIDAESFALSDGYVDSIGYVRNILESLPISDPISFVATALYAELLTASEVDAEIVAFQREGAESFSISDAYQDAIGFLRDVAEALSISDPIASSVTAAYGELINPIEADAGIVDFRRDAAESFSIAENYIDIIGFIVSVAEALAVTDALVKNADQPFADAFSVGEAYRNDLVQRVAEALLTSESYIDLIGFILSFGETLGIAEARRAIGTKRSAESFQLTDAMVRRIRAVIADLAFRSSGLTQAQFAEMLASRRPLGNYPRKTLQPGDYRYRKAVIGLTVEDIARTTDEVSVDTARLVVDVPDVTDRGSVAVASGGISIAFTRTFHEPPEIQVIQTGGSTRAIPSVSTITSTGFFVQLFDLSSPTTPVAGTISWTALGK